MKKVLLNILLQVLTVATPEIRRQICEALKELKKKTEKTPNPWDDILVDVLITLLGC